MSLELTVNDRIKKAMLARDEKNLRALRAIKAAILLAKSAEGGRVDLTVEDETRLLQKLVKSRKDSLEIFTQQNRPDLAIKEKEEIEVIEQFLPEQMGEDELKIAIAELISTNGATSPADMGKIMALATRQLAGKADGKAIASIVKSLLAK